MLPRFSYIRATTLDEALHHLAGDARVHAGGSDLLGCLRDGVFDCGTVVSISGLKQLEGIRPTEAGALAIGALTTVAEVAKNPLVQERYPGLAQAAASVASPQLRNQGTIGGNICQKPRCWYYRGEFPCRRKGGDTCFALAGENRYHCILGGSGCYVTHPSDTAPALTALEASIGLAGPAGTRWVPMEQFLVSPGDDPRRETVLQRNEIVTEIMVPAPATGLRTSYRKVRARGAWDFALAGVALALQFEGDRVRAARIVLSGAAPVPWRATGAEAIVTGSVIDERRARDAAIAALDGATPLRQNAYKIPLFRGLIEEELLALASG